eukprot:SAG31_NODE_40176_length_282_cov_1.191257_2_plen_56_part_01
MMIVDRVMFQVGSQEGHGEKPHRPAGGGGDSPNGDGPEDPTEDPTEEPVPEAVAPP